MKKLEFIPDTQTMEFESTNVYKQNYKFAEIIMSKYSLLPFEFPSFLQDETFYLQKMTISNSTLEHSFANYLELLDTYKKTLYFEKYDFIAQLVKGFYRIKAGNYISKNLIQVENFHDVELSASKFTDANGDSLVDATGDNLISL